MSKKNHRAQGALKPNSVNSEQHENPYQLFNYLSFYPEDTPPELILNKEKLFENLSLAADNGLFFAIALSKNGVVTIALTDHFVAVDERIEAFGKTGGKLLTTVLGFNSNQNIQITSIATVLATTLIRQKQIETEELLKKVTQSRTADERNNAAFTYKVMNRLQQELNKPDQPKEIFKVDYEPAYDTPYTDDLSDLMNMGYGGYGNHLHQDVLGIKDIRMLVNYYQFLLSNHCKVAYEKTERDYRIILHRATGAALSAIAENEMCKHIPVYGPLGNVTHFASDVASILINNCMDLGCSRMNYDWHRSEINNLIDDLQYYFYAHIDVILNPRNETNFNFLRNP